MKLQFDGAWLDHGPPSGRNVLQSILTTWSTAFEQDSLRVRASLGPARDVRAQPDSTSVTADDMPPRAKGRTPQAAIALTAGCNDVDAVITQNFAPLTGTAQRATFVHDVIFVRHPEWFTPLERAYLKLIRPSLRRADVIYTSSASERIRILEVWPEIRTRLVAVGLSTPLKLATTDVPTSPPFDADWCGNFILTVGRLNIRKNLARLIAGFERLGESEGVPKLIVVGSADGRSNAMVENASVIFLGSVSDETLAWLYSHCRFFVFPSMDEGFGLPLTEAQFFGAPVACSRIPAFVEQGDVDWYFDPSSEESIHRALKDALAATQPGIISAGPDSDPLRAWSDIVDRMRSPLERGIS